MDHYVRYSCRVFPRDAIFPLDPNSDPIDPSSGDQLFNIRVTSTEWNMHFPSMDIISHAPTSYGFFNIRKMIIEQVIYPILLSLNNIPEDAHNSMATKILDCARNMANNTHKNHKILYMFVDIDVYNFYDNNDDYHEAGEAPTENQHYAWMPASKSSIEGLERVKVESEEESNSCMVCLEDLKVDSQVVRMPCSHLFHRNCIINWLQHKNICPLCRFQMPTEDN